MLDPRADEAADGAAQEPPAGARPHAGQARGREGQALLLVLALTALAYARVFDNGYVYDDEMLILGSRVIHAWSNLPALFTHATMWASGVYSGAVNAVDTYRPLTLATFMWDSTLSGTEPWSYHVTNLAAHLACVALTFRLARVLLPGAGLVFPSAAAGFFALQPQAAEAHVWINGRSDVLATLLVLCATLQLHAATGQAGAARVRRELGIAALFLGALLCKEVAALVAPALVFWPDDRARPDHPRPSPRERAQRLWPFLLAIALYVPLRTLALGGVRAARDAEQAALALRHLPVLLVDALVESVAPRATHVRVLNEEYRQLPPAAFAAAAALVVAVLALCAWRFRRSQLPLWTATWFALPLAPVAMVSTLHWPGFGRYLYLPYVGLAVGLAAAAHALVQVLPRLRRLVVGALCAYALVFAGQLQPVIASFHDPGSLYVRAIDLRPDRAYGYALLAAALSSRLQALERVAELWETAWKLDPERDQYAIGLAQTHLVLKQPAQAAEAAERGLRSFPDSPDLRFLAAAGLERADPERAVGHLVRCLVVAPGSERCRDGLARMTQGPEATASRARLAQLVGGVREPSLRAFLERLARSGR